MSDRPTKERLEQIGMKLSADQWQLYDRAENGTATDSDLDRLERLSENIKYQTRIYDLKFDRNELRSQVEELTRERDEAVSAHHKLQSRIDSVFDRVDELATDGERDGELLSLFYFEFRPQEDNDE